MEVQQTQKDDKRIQPRLKSIWSVGPQKLKFRNPTSLEIHLECWAIKAVGEEECGSRKSENHKTTAGVPFSESGERKRSRRWRFGVPIDDWFAVGPVRHVNDLPKWMG
ncbi:hypothetical protein AVEN_191120-1 [Araneus ventricosus]|uniref:Uncharacterized protein n=1 Tax=Araneus ventricosus TaxID=182803 RepID=A0A4Y2AY18_ARAVE|nr:hypothetical protein AVEN_191120-1 [Araneus ventricosus]